MSIGSLSQKSTQRVTRAGEKDHIGCSDWRMIQLDRTPSWKVDGDGYAELEIRKCHEGILEISATEAGEKRTRNIFLTLRPDTAKSLLEFLNDGVQS